MVSRACGNNFRELPHDLYSLKYIELTNGSVCKNMRPRNLSNPELKDLD